MTRGQKPNSILKFYSIMFQEHDTYKNEVAIYALLKLLEKLAIIENP